MATCERAGSPPRGQGGFTYLGLLAFIAFLGILSAASVTAGAAFQRQGQEAELLFIGEQLRNALKSYYEATPAGQRPYPGRMEDLLEDKRRTGTVRHLRRIYVDPLTGQDRWGIIAAPGGGIAGVFSLSEARPFKQSGFPAGLSNFDNKEKYSEWVFTWGQNPVGIQNMNIPPKQGALLKLAD